MNRDCVLGIRSLGVAVVACVLWTGAPAQPQTNASPTIAEAISAFERIAAVLTHPRCLNCHQANAPLQGDSARPHMPPVLRGADSQGVGAMRCASCHREANNASSRVPGASDWQLAPASMAWSGLSTADLCRVLKDPAHNGNRTLKLLVHHMEHDPLVRWGWDPGGNRSPIPLAHGEFIDLLRLWAAADGPCPG
jgi:hypothetical protein